MRAWLKLRALNFRVLECSQRRYLALKGQSVSLKVSNGKLVRRSSGSHVVLESSLGCQEQAKSRASVSHTLVSAAFGCFVFKRGTKATPNAQRGCKRLYHN